MKFLNYILLSFLLLSCATPIQNYKKEHKSYLQKVRSAKQNYKTSDYKKFLNQQIQLKEMELINLESQKKSASGRYYGHQASSNPLGNQDIGQFQSRASQVDLHQIKIQKAHIKDELMLLKSQLSALP